jgi:hypothetical protein
MPEVWLVFDKLQERRHGEREEVQVSWVRREVLGDGEGLAVGLGDGGAAEPGLEGDVVDAGAVAKEWRMPTEKEFEAVMLDPPKPKDAVVVVKDARKLPQFDAGVTYVMEELEPRDKDFIRVYDKTGREDIYLRSRFKVCFE